ncbi:DNA-binding transcriptional regulator, MocR family, contains an aminotransferase domain [Filimonas lacunae]|uniref:DNA-binding transcriptional regulator, MocR family, contains an aminotransferase domain n=1 Tax=Filimonas lacunae TaxID=477680 RepID=A0A173MD82_9BACT|nr:PLP-dependent aminotransferase family protein [Filimonas lacunae]BAV05398.1 transcriptional regulator, GntR family domain [Filimonas lacunae]SIT21440.1 DNA-binding transcriptional regulator, MocR family, contains an aminotransferase domain [Filimonas lacunae]
MREPAYIGLANKIAGMIDKGIYKAEDKLPSLRSLHKENGLSIGTVLQAFNHLADQGLITAYEKSGYFVNPHKAPKLPVPQPVAPSLSTRSVHIDQLLQKLARESTSRNFVSFAGALPDDRLLPFNGIKRAIQQTSRDISGDYLRMETRQGNALLRAEIAKRSFLWKGAIHADELIITNGATEAILCALQAVTKPGDTVLVQDPCYYGIMQILECLHLKIATIPSHPETGITIEDFTNACQQLAVKACILVSNYNNPDGAVISTDIKKQLAAYANTQQLPIIEDDLYGELFFTGSRPDTIKAYDTDGWVLYCSSFTKTLVPGFRIGWCAGGRFTYEITRIKSMHNGATSNFSQRVIQLLLSSGSYDRHLHQYRRALHHNLVKTTRIIEQHFPPGTRITSPTGGLVLWLELPDTIHTSQCQDIAFQHHITYTPGELFSSKGDYTQYLRISLGNFWEPRIEKALITLGGLLNQSSVTV